MSVATVTVTMTSPGGVRRVVMTAASMPGVVLVEHLRWSPRTCSFEPSRSLKSGQRWAFVEDLVAEGWTVDGELGELRQAVRA